MSLLPENDRWSETRAQLMAQMDVSMGGRVAEELIFGNENITTGETCFPLIPVSFLDHVDIINYCLFFIQERRVILMEPLK